MPYVGGGCVGGCNVDAGMMPNEVMFVQHRVPTALPIDPKNWADHVLKGIHYNALQKSQGIRSPSACSFPAFLSSEPSQWPLCL